MIANRRQVCGGMLLSIIMLLSTLATECGSIFPEPDYPWMKKGPNDQRGPCPALNSLANHGYIPRNGTGIPLSLIAQAGERVYSVAESTLLNIMNLVIGAGIPAGETSDGELTLTLSDLYPHNIAEHDASLVRRDEYFEPLAQFNSDLLTKLLDTSTTSDSLTLQDVVFASQQRIIDSRVNNPNASFAHNGGILPIQMADEKLFVMLAGNDPDLLFINKSDVEQFFRYDRIPQDHVSRQDLGLAPINLEDDFTVEFRNDIAAQLNETMFGPLPTSATESFLSYDSAVLSILLVLALCFTALPNTR